MPQIIKRYDAVFTGINEPITLSIPRGSVEQAIRVYRDTQSVTIFTLEDDPPVTPPDNYERTFMLILIDQTVPPTFKKYIGTVPFGTGNIQTHIVEI